ncbi:MAG: hypothetical protein IH861_04220 [Chloroflexi bacterium]|nr:hypothetical protein [Chloroflexota bacterium]
MWYLVLSRVNTSPDEVRKMSQEHLGWMEGQYQGGKVLFSGPKPDRSVGIYAVKAGSYDEARALVDTEPFHAAGLRGYEIIECEIHQVLGAGTFTSPVSGG